MLHLDATPPCLFLSQTLTLHSRADPAPDFPMCLPWVVSGGVSVCLWWLCFCFFFSLFVPLRVRERSDSRSSRRPVIGESQATLTGPGCGRLYTLRGDPVGWAGLCAFVRVRPGGCGGGVCLICVHVDRCTVDV